MGVPATLSPPPSLPLPVIWLGNPAVLGGVGKLALVVLLVTMLCAGHEGDMCTEGGGVCGV